MLSAFDLKFYNSTPLLVFFTSSIGIRAPGSEFITLNRVSTRSSVEKHYGRTTSQHQQWQQWRKRQIQWQTYSLWWRELWLLERQNWKLLYGPWCWFVGVIRWENWLDVLRLYSQMLRLARVATDFLFYPKERLKSTAKTFWDVFLGSGSRL